MIKKTNEYAEFTCTFSSKDYFLVYDEKGDNGFYWSLNPRIDRSYKGKDDDVAPPQIYIEEEDALELIKAGFLLIEL